MTETDKSVPPRFDTPSSSPQLPRSQESGESEGKAYRLLIGGPIGSAAIAAAVLYANRKGG